MALPARIDPPELDAMIQQVRYASIRRAFESDAEVAEVFRVNRSAVTHWKRGEPMGAANQALLQALDTTVALLSAFRHPTTVPKWLRGVNAFLGDRRPLDMLRAGRLSDVVRAIEAERSEAFA